MSMNIIKWVDQRKNWWKVFAVIFAISVGVVGRIGYQSYAYAPPERVNFVAEDGTIQFSADDIVKGKQVFLDKVLMDYGSFLGDGGMRGPDFTAEALNLTARYMNEYYLANDEQMKKIPEELREAFVKGHVQQELKTNRLDTEYYAQSQASAGSPDVEGAVVLSPAQVYAYQKVKEYYRQKFGEGGDLVGEEKFEPSNYISNPEKVEQIAAFFY